MLMSNDSGIVTSEMSVVRAFIKKIHNTSTTKTPPSMSDFFMLEIEESIKSFYR